MPRLTPHPYQEESIQRAISEPTRSVLIGDEVGRGKTLQAAEIAIRLGLKRVLLIGIDATFPEWAETLAGQSEGAIQLRKMESSKDGREVFADFLSGKDGYYFAGITWIQRQDVEYKPAIDQATGKPMWAEKKVNGVWTVQTKAEKDPDFIGPAAPKQMRIRKKLNTFIKMCNRKGSGLDGLIFDEAHAVASHKSVQRRTLLNFHGGDRGQMWKIALSATWSGNSFEHAWSLPDWLWPNTLPAYYEWRKIWVAEEPALDKNGKQVYANGKMRMKVVGEKGAPGTFVKTLPCYLRNEAEETAPPAIDIVLESTPRQRQQWEELKQELFTWVRGHDGYQAPLIVDIPGVLHSRLKEIALAELSVDAAGETFFRPDAASAKLGALKGVLDHWGNQPVGLFTDSKKFATLTAERMQAAGYRAAAWHGDVKKADRLQLKKDFIEGRVQYLVGTVGAMGTGLDGLQKVCSKVVWLSQPEGNPSLLTQALGRYFRPGRTLAYGDFQQVRLLMKDSPDIESLDNLLAKAWAVARSISADALAA